MVKVARIHASVATPSRGNSHPLHIPPQHMPLPSGTSSSQSRLVRGSSLHQSSSSSTPPASRDVKGSAVNLATPRSSAVDPAPDASSASNALLGGTSAAARPGSRSDLTSGKGAAPNISQQILRAKAKEKADKENYRSKVSLSSLATPVAAAGTGAMARHPVSAGWVARCVNWLWAVAHQRPPPPPQVAQVAQ